MSKHSKAPWTLDGFYKGDKSSPIYSKSKNICEPVCTIPHDDITERGFEEVEANAALIAAAPDLLAALVDAERTLAAMHKDGWKVGGDLIERVRAALASAQPAKGGE